MNSPRIAELNDRLRKLIPFAPDTVGLCTITAGVNALSERLKADLFQAVRTFSDFSEDNDPYGEHDFGKVVIAGRSFFWKIDCYDTDLIYASPDPANPAVTKRVLTIMLAEEY